MIESLITPTNVACVFALIGTISFAYGIGNGKTKYCWVGIASSVIALIIVLLYPRM